MPPVCLRCVYFVFGMPAQYFPDWGFSVEKSCRVAFPWESQRRLNRAIQPTNKLIPNVGGVSTDVCQGNALFCRGIFNVNRPVFCTQHASLVVVLVLFSLLSQRWGTADAEIKALSAEHPKLSNVPALKPEVGQNITFHASPTAWNSTFLISAFLVHSTSFFSILLLGM